MTYNSYQIDLPIKLKRDIKTRLSEIANLLLAKADSMTDFGLFHGRMGIAIFFYYYAKFTNEKDYEESADELVDSVLNESNLACLGTDYANGIIGIGAAIEYLVQNEIMEGDTDIVLEELDELINCKLEKNVNDNYALSFLWDCLKYYNFRIGYKQKNTDCFASLVNKEKLLYLADFIPEKINWCYDNLNAINNLCDIYKLDIYNSKITCMLDYACQKLETALWEHLFFNSGSASLELLTGIQALIQSFQTTENYEYYEKANRLLKAIEVRKEQDSPKEDFYKNKDILRYAIAYYFLSETAENNRYKLRVIKWL